MAVHAAGITVIVVCATYLISARPAPIWPVAVYICCSLASNLSSQAYHFAPWHAARPLLRRIDHAAIYISITGTFTPLLIAADTARASWVLGLTWLCAAVGIWLKLVSSEVKSRWSTASYLLLGLLSFAALPDVWALSQTAVWWILAGSACYVIGTVFYTRKAMPYRYAVWHAWVVLGALAMFIAVWNALF